MRKEFYLLIGFSLVMILFPNVLSWYDSGNYPYRYPIESVSETDGMAYSVNGTGGVGLYDIAYWTANTTEPIWLYCQNSGCINGLVAVANDTDVKSYENESLLGGGSTPTEIWDANYKTVILANDLLFNDSTSNSYQSIHEGNAGTVVDGVFGKAVNCESDGGSGGTSTRYVQEWSYTPTAYTIEVWVKIESLPTTMGNIYRWVDGNAKLQLLIWANSSFRFYHDGHATDLCYGGATEIGQWYYIVGAWDGSWYYGYVNGTLVCSFDANSLGTGGDANVICGNNAGDGNYGYDGDIDGFKFSSVNRSLTYILEQWANGQDALASLGTMESFGASSPQWKDNLTLPTTPTSYSPGKDYQFNITCYGEPIQNGYVTLNSTVYEMTNETSEYYYDFKDLGAGTYVYTMTCNSTSNAQNSTTSQNYVVSKNTTTNNLYLNGTEANITATYPATTNATATNSITGTTGITLLRDGVAVSNPEVISLASGTHNYTATYSHENYTASSVTNYTIINQATSGLSLTADPSWTLAENIAVTVTCSANAGITHTLTKDGVTVTSPYSASLGFGSYVFNCTLSDTWNYTPSSTEQTLTIQPGGFGCVDTGTFAFKQTIDVSASFMVTLNFTGLVEMNYTWDDLRDVYVNTTVNATYMNKTGNNYYLVVNVTGIDSIDVLFGNYISNNTYTETSISENTTTIENYREINDYTVMFFYNEKTGSYLLPPDANVTVSQYCSGGSSSFSLNHTKILIPSFMDLDELKTTVQYSATEIYYRNLQVRSDVEHRKFYMVDANLFQVVEILIKLQDDTGDFGGATLKAKKYLEGAEETITELPFDAENKVIVYLINADKYTIYVDNDEEERNIGYLYVDTTDLEKTLVIGEATTTNLTEANISFSLSLDSGAITFTWFDLGRNTNEIELWVFNYTNQSQQLYYASSTNRSSINFNYVVPDENATYTVRWLVKHGIFGNQTTGGQRNLVGFLLAGLDYPSIFPLATLITNLGGDATIWMSFLFILPVAMLFTEKYAGVGAIVLVAITGLMVYWGQYTLASGVIGLSLFIGVMIYIQNKKRGGT